MTIWFSADHHFGHENIIKYTDRPFASVEEMDSVLIEKWNECVEEEDMVYYLGDFTLGSFQRFEWYINQLNGKFYFVPGGHDRRWVDPLTSWWPIPGDVGYELISGEKVTILPQLHHLNFPSSTRYPTTITLCHYPMLSWEKSHYGSPHLHGHSHGTFGCMGDSGDVQLPPDQTKGKRLDVGVDCMGFEPISLEEVINELDLDIVQDNS